MKELSEIRLLRVNRYVILDDEPCKIMSISTSKPGKHGESKARIEAIGIFDGQKRSVVHPVKHKVHIPIIDKRSAQWVKILFNLWILKHTKPLKCQFQMNTKVNLHRVTK